MFKAKPENIAVDSRTAAVPVAIKVSDIVCHYHKIM